jgi:NAD(P)-dependent dehydrogenase (short-subunit alcohol dehydrogenase family)
VTAIRFLREGWHVVATVRREADRADLIKDAGSVAGRLSVVLADITQEADVARLRDVVYATSPTLEALVNNAGTAFAAPLEILPLADLRAQLEINVVAQLAVTQALLPRLKAGRGAIVNVSSISGRIASPGIGAYSASKFALEAMSDALRVELAPFGVRVVVIEPGSSPTKIFATTRARAESRGIDVGAYAPLVAALARRADEGASAGFPPELFADTVWQCVTSASPRTRYPIPAGIRRLVMLRRLLSDNWFDRRIRRLLGW